MVGLRFKERVSLRELRHVCGYGVDLQLNEVRLVCSMEMAGFEGELRARDGERKRKESRKVDFRIRKAIYRTRIADSRDKGFKEVLVMFLLLSCDEILATCIA